MAEKPFGGQKVHTQGVDGLWGHLKTWLRAKRGVHAGTLQGHIGCFEWRARTKDKNRFTALLEAMRAHAQDIQGERDDEECADDEDGSDLELERIVD